MECDCQAWQENYRWIRRAVNLARAYNYLQEAVPFRFCPWCGEELYDEKAEYDKIINGDPSAKKPEGCLNGNKLVYK